MGGGGGGGGGWGAVRTPLDFLRNMVGYGG